MKRVTKKVPLFLNSAKKDTLISDLLRSEPHSEKGTLSENFCTRMLTHIVEVAPPGSVSLPLQLEESGGNYCAVIITAHKDWRTDDVNCTRVYIFSRRSVILSYSKGFHTSQMA